MRRSLHSLASLAPLLGSLALAGAGCGHDAPPPRPPPSRAVTTAPPAPRPPPVEGSYWEPVEPELRKTFGVALELPLQPERLAQFEGAARAVDRATPAGRAGFLQNGFAVARLTPPRAPGAFYVDLRERNVPYVVTFDALLHVAHLGVDRALADLEERVIARDLPVLLERIAARLDIESVKVGPDLLPGFRIARGLVAVARGLLGSAAPTDLAPLVKEELALARARAGLRTSPVLGVRVDYTLFPPEPGGGVRDALAWLALAPLAVVARSEAEGAPVDVGEARAHTRAAMLLARAVDPAVDAQSHELHARLARVGRFVAGPSDDVGLTDLGDAARRVGADLRDPAVIANVAKVDRVRAELRSRAPVAAFDGAGGVRARRDAGPRATPVGLAGLSVRVLGFAATEDARALQSLVFPMVGESSREPPPITATVGVRALPTALDVGALLGAPDARALLHETGDDAYAGYGASLDRLAQLRAPAGAPERHASFHASMLDALSVYLAPSAADRLQSYGQSPLHARRKLEAALVGWTLLRHDLRGSSRAKVTELPRIVRNLSRTPPPAAFVEPHPEALARLLGALAQLQRGLGALGAIPKGSSGGEVLREAIAIVSAAYELSVAMANDETFSPAASITLGELPSKIAELEALVGPEVAAPVACDVHTDLAAGRALVEATAPVDEALFALRDPGSPKVVVAVGVALPHLELIHPVSLRMSDARWRARLDAEPELAASRPAWARAYRFDEAEGRAK